MTLRIESRKPSTSRTRWILRWCAPILLFVFGISALGYCGYVMLDAHFSQNDQVRRFDQALLTTLMPRPTRKLKLPAQLMLPAHPPH